MTVYLVHLRRIVDIILNMGGDWEKMRCSLEAISMTIPIKIHQVYFLKNFFLFITLNFWITRFDIRFLCPFALGAS
jgi:hypothetical protein